MRFSGLIAMMILLSGCVFSPIGEGENRKQEAVNCVIQLVTAYVESDWERFGELVHDDFGWNGMTKQQFVEFVREIRNEEGSMEIASASLDAKQLLSDVWRVSGATTVTYTFDDWPVPQTKAVFIEWDMRETSGGFKLFAMTSTWSI